MAMLSHPLTRFIRGPRSQVHSQTNSHMGARGDSLWPVFFFPALAHAKDAPEGAIGRIEGYDVSVEGGVPAGNGTETNAPAVFVSNGSIVTVHSGAARMSLTSGGHVDICGPAKFTLLEAGGAITLALNFGRMRVQLPTNTQLRIFTPTIIGTPLDVDGVPRDITFGLGVDDSLCVLATNGAIQLEHQFSGEKLIVPQDGEFFLSSGKLLPVAGTPGTCECAAMQPRALPSQPPEYATTSAPPVIPAPLMAPAPEAPSIPPAAIAALPAAEALGGVQHSPYIRKIFILPCRRREPRRHRRPRPPSGCPYTRR